ncbi:recombinase family protein [Glycomyces sp. A-F 0318]|uniref:recombinase family protein n=1 Tax=Glycomyces amatae TaxID=2881355 RepID=UPI001E4B72E2|nr:recombinase family protein [Glycomyces amatae]
MIETPAPADLVLPVPAAGIVYGYARVSTREQRLDSQIEELRRRGCRRIFTDKLSGKNADRPGLAEAFDFGQAGDLLMVTRLDRLGRSLQDLVVLVDDLKQRQIGFTSIKESIDTTTPGGRLVFHIFASLAEFIRELIVEGTREGLAAAKVQGRTGGRPTVVDAQLLAQARDLLPNPEHSIKSIARLLGVSAGTLYNHIPDLKELRDAGPRAIETGDRG